MNFKTVKRIFSTSALTLLIFTCAVYATSDYSTQSDPLVSLSYISGVKSDLQNQITDISDKVSEIQANGVDVASSQYSTVALEIGQKLIAKGVCEIILRNGHATATSTQTSGLVDTVNGFELFDGYDITKNHYIIAEASMGVLSSQNNTVLLVRGNYEIK